MTLKNMFIPKINVFSKKILHVQDTCNGWTDHLAHLAHVGRIQGKPLSGAVWHLPAFGQSGPKVCPEEEKPWVQASPISQVKLSLSLILEFISCVNKRMWVFKGPFSP